MWHCLCVRQPWHVAAGRASGGAGGPPRVGLPATLAVRAEPVLRGSLAEVDGFRQLSGALLNVAFSIAHVVCVSGNPC